MLKKLPIDVPGLALLCAALLSNGCQTGSSPSSGSAAVQVASAATSVVWSVQEAGGGTVDSSGLYTAPSGAGSFNVVATSAVSPTVAGAAAVTVTSGGGGSEIIAAARRTTWNPGLNAVGGIPNRTTICATANAATYGNGTTDATAYLTGLINACPAGQVVYLPAGTYLISGGNGILFTRSNVTLRGAGPSATRLVKNAGSNGPVIHIGPRWSSDKFNTSINLTSNAVKGSRTATVASASGLSSGQLVLVDATTDPAVTWLSARMDVGGADYPAALTWFFRTNRPVAQIMEIESISGTTVTFTTPFHLDFTVARTAQVSINANAATTMAGVEDLYVSGGEGGDSGGNIHLSMAKYSWVKNVESNYSQGTAINFDAAFRSEVRDSYIHTGGVMEPGGGGYLLGLNRGAADCLIENNILWNANKVMVVRAAGGGSVFGYNYAEDGRIASNPGFVEVGLNASHMTTPFMVLFEGNQGWNFDSDEVWGNSVYMTVFRNYLTTKRGFYYSPANGGTDKDMRFAAGSGAHSWYFNFVGNVLGQPGNMLTGTPQSSQVYEATTGAQTNNAGLLKMWMLGHGPGGNPTDTPSATVISQTLRHGNYDYVSGSVVWDAATSNHALPASLYLTGKPSFFGTLTWPWVTPDGSTKVFTLPAKARFDAMPSH